jgi:glyceraldehyde-3-phosphate dehydrogenase (NAD(P))
VAQANYAEALGREAVRVVSCNTTGLVRLLSALQARNLVQRARAVLVRRATDPWESHKGGMVNTLLPETTIPSHQGPDAQTVLPGLDVVTIAAAGPFNLSHVHFAIVEAPAEVDRKEVLAALRDAPRIAFVRAADWRGGAERGHRDRPRSRPAARGPVGGGGVGGHLGGGRPGDLPYLPGPQ